MFLLLPPFAFSIDSKMLGLWAGLLEVFVLSSIMMPQA